MKLNHAEIIVKRTMLDSPLISKSRLAVLSHILLREPFAQWGEDGCVHVHNVKETNPRKAVMKKLDHLEKPLDINKELQELVPDFYEARLVEREMEIMQYAFMEKHIDCFAKHNMSHQAGLKAEVLTANAKNALIFSIPDNVEASWKKASLEVIDAVLLALREEKFIARNLNGEKNDPLKAENWRMGYWASMYEKFHNVREQLSPPVSNRAVLDLSAMWDSVVNPK